MEADFETGLNAYKNGDYKTAKKHFVPLQKRKICMPKLVWRGV